MTATDHSSETDDMPTVAAGPDYSLPSDAEMQAAFKLIEDNAQRIFTWKYDREREQLVTLYNKAMASQWNSVTELDWSTDVDPEREANHDHATVHLARRVAEMPGSPLKNWGDKEYRQLALELQKAQLSQFMHGEQGAMMVAAKIVETVPWIDAKYYASTQTMDEARHTEVFAKYLHEKLGEAYPMSPFLEDQITVLLEDDRWDIAYLGMQIIIESLALAAFGDMLRTTQEPLLKKLLRYVMADEARHVAFGILSLGEYYQELTDAELKDRQEFMVENTIRSRSRASTPEVWERMGVKFDDVLPLFMEAVKESGRSPINSFQRGFFAKLVPNTRKLGLLDRNGGFLREQWEQAGLMEFEFAEDTASDYEAYDEVAKDRAAAAAG
ncbi:ferritin-like domain-containing protein [Actinomarinicola tropica]|uniref:Ferritin-like domain-containing protein n=1 Tax=Actinomarinicola tropica TaxID=2789776 RepID=A0A5Q2RDS4_9ACTN|nr:ferritin-like domain-containing protein [Actinomarinicola tropica]QGG95039.1 ferritin-like domain-containing protein [Actinomarinicola tropica]